MKPKYKIGMLVRVKVSEVDPDIFGVIQAVINFGSFTRYLLEGDHPEDARDESQIVGAYKEVKPKQLRTVKRKTRTKKNVNEEATIQ